jgi:hypothetical protein
VALAHFTAHDEGPRIVHRLSEADALLLLTAMAWVRPLAALQLPLVTTLQVPSLAPVQALVPMVTITPVESRHLF